MFLLISLVYTRCNTQERLELWDELQCFEPNSQIPWIIGGGFNAIFNEEEKLGGLVLMPSS